MFPTPWDNILYFCGFFALLALHTYTYILFYSFGEGSDLLEKLFLAVSAGLLALAIIRIKIDKIRSTPISNLPSPSQIVQKIKLHQK